MNFNVFLVVYGLLVLKSENCAEAAECQYSDKTVNIYFRTYNKYTCDFSIGDDESLESVTEIDGDHEDEKADGDVKMLQSYSYGTIQKFSSFFCEKFSNLEAIKVEDLKIKSIDNDSLQKCPNLKFFHFERNEVREIPENLLSENTELLEIQINSNQLESLAQDTFEMQENLKKLFLNNNKIATLPSRIFKTLKNLERLHLDENRIETLDPEWFKKLTKLEKLSLNSNKITELPRRVFLNLNNLQMLELNSNLLTVINANSFGYRGKLAAVNINFNKINAIDRNFISKSLISMLGMEDNDCFQGSVLQRSSMNQNLEECFHNFNDATTPITTPSTTPSITTTTTTTPRSSTPFPFTPFGIISTVPTRIIKYKNFARGVYPWIAAIMRLDGSYQCGGILVTDQKVVTAATSMFVEKQELLPRSINVLLGSHTLFDGFETGKEVKAVSRIRIHPEFDINSPLNDANIAVIVLDTPVLFKKFIKPIEFMNLNSDVLSVAAVTHASYGNRDTLKLKSIVTPKHISTSILENEDCPGSADVRSFCIANSKNSAICTDDIGSGLYIRHHHKYYLRGIVSAVVGSENGNCDGSSYSIFTDISKFNDWIEEAPIEDPDSE